LRRKTPRAICLEILNYLIETDRHPDHLLSDSFKRYRHLTSLDRGFLTELTYGVLRWRERLDWSIRQLSKIPFEKIEMETLNILRLGLYQIEFLTRTPASAAVNESVELAKRHRASGSAGFVNAVLRTFIRKRKEISYPEIRQDPAHHISILHSHPLWLVQRWIEEMGVETTLNACEFNNRISPLTLRANTLKVNREELMERLKERGLKPIPADYSPDGILLDDPPPVSGLPLLNEGWFIIQDEASQLVTSILDPKAGETILDGCASPGGKATHAAQRMENKGEVYAVDLTKDKLVLIEEMGRRLGIKIVKTMKGDATRPLSGLKEMTFDRVLADVPCSGFGTLRKNPDVKWRKGEGDIKRLGELQLTILNNLSGYVRKRGVLVYSTCTVFREENEEVIEHFLKSHPEFQPEPVSKFLPETCHPFVIDGCLKTFPPKNRMDGFFAARLLRKD
jgi:16S rRNA (cytosine967-C5)-methyltransferase